MVSPAPAKAHSRAFVHPAGPSRWLQAPASSPGHGPFFKSSKGLADPPPPLFCPPPPVCWYAPIYFLFQVESLLWSCNPGPAVIENASIAYLSEPADLSLLSPTEKAVRLGDLCFRAGRYDKAVEAYLEALALSPDQADLYFILSDALFAIGDYHFAAYAIRCALELDPGLAGSRADKREFYGDRDDFVRQLRTLERFLQGNPGDGDAWLVLGYNLLFSGDPEGAIRAWNRALEVREDSAARVFLDSLRRK